MPATKRFRSQNEILLGVEERESCIWSEEFVPLNWMDAAVSVYPRVGIVVWEMTNCYIKVSFFFFSFFGNRIIHKSTATRLSSRHLVL